jgi:hypothetical protein
VTAAVKRPYRARAADEEAPWEDRSLVYQEVTPWRDDDARRYGVADWEARDRRLSGRFVAAAVVLLLVAGAAFSGWYFWDDLARHAALHQAAGPVDWHSLSDLDLVPRSGAGLLSLHVAAWWDGKAGRPVRPLLTAGPEAELLRVTGLSFGDIERVTVAIPRSTVADLKQVGDGLVFVQTRRPYDRGRVQTGLTEPGRKVPSKHGLDVYLLTGSAKGRVTFPNDRVIVVGHAASMAYFVSTRPNPKADGPLAAPLALAAAGHPLVAFFEPSPPLGPQLRRELPPALRPYESLFDFSRATLTADGDEALRLDLRLEYPTADAASRAGAAAQSAVRQGEQTLKGFRQELQARQAGGESARQAAQAALAVGAAAASLPAPLGTLPLLQRRALLPPAAKDGANPDDALAARAVDLAGSVLATARVQSPGKEVEVTLTVDRATLAAAAPVLASAAQKVREAARRSQNRKPGR